MKLLLDTHIFLWSLFEPERLENKLIAALNEPENEKWLSPITVWECLLLSEKKRYVFPSAPELFLRDVIADIGLREAPLNVEIAMRSRTIRLRHDDPADRFLAATADLYALTLVTADRRLQKCPDISVWKI